MPPANLKDVLVHFQDFGLPDSFDTEPVVAWRGWELDMSMPYDPRLASITQSTVRWPGRQPLVAECRRLHSGHKCGTSPRLACTCGIYGLTDPTYYRDSTWFHQIPSRRVPKYRVYGLVSLWGYVIKHETGYRASCAYPYELVLPMDVADVADVVRQKYGVDVTVREREEISSSQ